MVYHRLTSGIPGLDDTVKGLTAGDNVVFRVGSIDDYRALVTPFVAACARAGTPIHYIRFATHPPLLDGDSGAAIHVLHPQDGFERFLADLHTIIEAGGHGPCYVLDSLSDLVGDWYSDQMLANFFTLTCPYLYDLRTIAYFAIQRGTHSSRAIDPILATTQLFLDVYRHRGDLFVRPVKVQHRFASTMEMLHRWEGDRFTPVTRSNLVADILHAAAEGTGVHATLDAGPWDRAFIEAETHLQAYRTQHNDHSLTPQPMLPLLRRLLRMIFSRDEAMLALAERHLSIENILDIRQRMIGTGQIGGKSAGMLLARAILSKASPRFTELLETHDSYYIGSDAFYTYLVNNGVWWVRQKQRRLDTFLEGADQARQNILTGTFPPHMLRQFDAMLDYFGRSPIIVRSSSLLEDNFGNAFAGKYESVFCANQGPRERRRDDFLAAVRAIYTSSMSEEALRYRASRGLLEHDEQMALLVMRVSGSDHGGYHYPHLAGVGFSWNPYAWSEHIDPAAGVTRMVFGLGTRAVDRSDDDYTRVVALNDPTRRPESNFDEVRQYAQRRVDFLDLEANQLISGSYQEVLRREPDVPLELFLADDPRSDGTTGHPVLTFDGALRDTTIVADLRAMLAALQEAYTVPVDIEYAASFDADGSYHLNLLQCRPLPVTVSEAEAEAEADLGDESDGHRLLEARGAVIGHSRVVGIDRLIYVVPSRYGMLPIRDRYALAQVLGRLNERNDGHSTLLLGPGRWGTSSPSLGIPLRFCDINNCAALCEIVCMRDDLVPDVSLGTHFLNELIEEDILYLALFPNHGANRLDEAAILEAPNRIAELSARDADWADLIHVSDPPPAPGGLAGLTLRADARQQQVSCRLA